MKRILSLLLGILLCLCGCNESVKPIGTITQVPQTEPTKADERYTLSRYVEDAKWRQLLVEEQGIRYGDRVIHTLPYRTNLPQGVPFGDYLLDGVPTGTWYLMLDRVDIDGKECKLRRAGDAFFLVSRSGAIWTTAAGSQIGIRTISIDKENWELYFAPVLVKTEVSATGGPETWAVGFALKEEYAWMRLSGQLSMECTYNGMDFSCEQLEVAPFLLGAVHLWEDGQILASYGGQEICGFGLGLITGGGDLDFQMGCITGSITLLDFTPQTLE